MKNHPLFQQIMRAFCLISTCITIGLAAFLTVFSVETIPSAALWQVPLVSFIIALTGGLIYYSRRELSKKAYLVRNVLHFVLIGAMLFLSANLFNWFKYANFRVVIIFTVLVVLIYVIVSVIIYYYVKNYQAKLMNEKLNEFKQKCNDDVE